MIVGKFPIVITWQGYGTLKILKLQKANGKEQNVKTDFVKIEIKNINILL